MKIDIIVTGGTICSEVEGDEAVIKTDFGRLALTGGYSHEFGTHCPYSIHSENLLPAHWERLKNSIDGAGETDGLIVLHGTDTLAYTAAFLSFAYADTDFPIVLVAANAPVGRPQSNAADNFDMAVAAIENGAKGVYVSYKNPDAPKALFPANKIVGFLPFCHSLCAIDRPYAVYEQAFDVTGKPFGEKKLAPRFPVNGITFIPAVPATDYSAYLANNKQPDAYLVELFHSSSCCVAESDEKYSLAHFILRCKERGIKVFAAPYQTREYYYPSRRFLERATSLKDMTAVCAYVALLISDLEKIADDF